MKRNNTLDIAKSLGIILVVALHSYHSTMLVHKYVNAFIMPLFFMVSGILLGQKGRGAINFDVRKRIISLMVPYVFFEVIYAVWYGLFSYLLRHDSMWSVFMMCLRDTCLFLGCGPTWFIPCLLIAQMLLYLLHCVDNKMLEIELVLALYAFAVWSPWGEEWIALERGFIALFFLYIGYMFSHQIMAKQRWYTILVMIAVFVFSSYSNTFTSICAGRYGNAVLYAMSGVSGSCLVIWLSGLLSKALERFAPVETIRYIGENSVMLLGTHMIGIDFIRLIDNKLTGDVLKTLGLFEAPIIGGIVVLCSIPFIKPTMRVVQSLIRRIRTIEVGKKPDMQTVIG